MNVPLGLEMDGSGRDRMPSSQQLTLHAYWHRDQLLLWGERSTAAEGSAALATAGDLRAAVGELSPDALLASVAVESRQRLWLPCDARGPIGCAAARAAPDDPGGNGGGNG